MAMKKPSLKHHLSALPDPRSERGRRHLLLDVMIMAVLATLCGAGDWESVEAFGEEQDAGCIGAPHLIRLEGSDRAVMNPRAEFPARPSGGLQAVATHEETNPLLVGADALVAQAGVDLSIAFSQERWIGQDAVDGGQEFGVGNDGARSTLLRGVNLGGSHSLGIDRGAGDTKFLTDGH